MNEEPYPVFSGFGGIGGIKIPLPLNLIPGQQYDICTEFEGERHLVERITIESGCPSVCTLEIPRNPFVVKQGAGITTLAVKMKGPSGTYNLSLRQCADKSCNRELNRPESVQLRASSAIITIPPLPSEETVYVDATGPHTEDNQNYWANIRLEAALQTDESSSCMVTFDYDVTAIAAREDDCEYNDHFLEGDTVCSGRTILRIIPPGTYPFHVVDSKDWASNNTIPSTCDNCDTSLPSPMLIATDTIGDLQCRTTLWANARATSYPSNNRANFDIVIDVDRDGLFVEGIDILDSFVLHADVDSDGDGRNNFIDNCPTTPNPNQEDIYPPDGNSSPPTDNCGDACECEGDVQSATLGEGYPDGDVDGSDAFVFKENFGRTDCATSPPCLRDYECDSDVDGTDAFKFKEEFGTVGCPSCTFNCLYE